MASGESETEMSHGKTEIKMTIEEDEFGPLSVIDGGKYVNTFRGGKYWITTPKDDYLVLYRLCGGAASEDGQYWTAELQEKGQTYRDLFAVARSWNSLEERAYLVVPKDVYVYEGIAAPHGNYPGGGLQVFIPKSIVEPLHSFPVKHMARNSESDVRRYQQVKHGVLATQAAMFKRYEEGRKERIERMESIKSNPSRGNHFRSLPPALQTLLRNSTTGTSTASKEVISQGTYKLHEKRVKCSNGSHRTFSLSVKTEFVKSTTRTYQSGRTTIVETTNYYNIIYIWS